MREDDDSIFDISVHQSETTLVEVEEDTVFVALFTTPTAQHIPCECAKRHRSSCTISAAALMEKILVHGRTRGRTLRLRGDPL